MNQPKWGGVRQTCLLDTYNQTIYTDFAPTISTRVDASSNTYIMEVKVIGKCWKSSQNGLVYSTEGVSPTIVSGCHSGVEPKIMEVIPLNPYKDGTARTIKAQYHKNSMENLKKKETDWMLQG